MKHFYLIIILCATITYNSVSQTKSSKRGIAYSLTNTADLNVLAPGISWFYNWAQAPNAVVKPLLSSKNVEFVPMIWNGNQTSITVANSYCASNPDNRYLLGFNEPNFPDQANMTPSVAAAFWPKLEQLATTYNLKLIAPVTNYSAGIYDVKYGKVMYQDPYSYLDTFFSICPSCKVDYIAVHWYGHGGLETVVNTMWNKYKKPIWVTEFASWDNSIPKMTLQLEKEFMLKYVDWLENNPNVMRYAWFTGRATNNDYIDILGSSGKLTELGELYLKMPVHDTAYYQTIPARIESENYSVMSGILLQTSTDVDGVFNVSSIEPKDYLDYYIEVPENKSYPIKVRYSATKTTQFSIREGETVLTNVSLSSTGSSTIWSTKEIALDLTAGKHKIRFFAMNTGFILNWAEFGEVATSIDKIELNQDFRIINNPVDDGILRIITVSDTQNDIEAKFELFDISGRLVLAKNISINPDSEIQIFINENGLAKAGLYLARITSATTFFSSKIEVK